MKKKLVALMAAVMLFNVSAATVCKAQEIKDNTSKIILICSEPTDPKPWE